MAVATDFPCRASGLFLAANLCALSQLAPAECIVALLSLAAFLVRWVVLLTFHLHRLRPLGTGVVGPHDRDGARGGRQRPRRVPPHTIRSIQSRRLATRPRQLMFQPPSIGEPKPVLRALSPRIDLDAVLGCRRGGGRSSD